MSGLVSVIIPCYNSEKYVVKCVDSILAQTYREMEIILVNDGSKDRTGEILHEYAEKDSRVKVIDKENGGLSDARNKGIEDATGKYIVFVDSDDYVLANHVESLVALIEKYDCKMAISPFELVNEGEEIGRQAEHTERVYEPAECLGDMFYQRTFETTAHDKIYRRELFDEIRFKKGLIYEDLYIMPDLIMSCERIAFTTEKTYAYVMRNGSIEGSGFTDKKYSSVREIVEKIDRDTRLDPIRRAADCRIFSLISRMYFSMPEGHPERGRVWEEMKRRRKGIAFNGKARMKNRLAAVLTYLGPSIAGYIYRKTKTR